MGNNMKRKLVLGLTMVAVVVASLMYYGFRYYRCWSNVETLKRNAERGDPNAQCALAAAYELGIGLLILPKDDVEAVKWSRRAAEQGNATAQGNLARLYSQGIGIPKDDVEVAHWFLKCAEQGNATAQALLGSAYEYGHGVPQDKVEAYKWFDLAAAVTGDHGDIRRRDDLVSHMTPDQIAEGTKRAAAFVPKKASP
jgi:hypothetical protein